jgi:hypothetical protein
VLNASEFWLSDPAVHCKDALCYRGQIQIGASQGRSGSWKLINATISAKALV